MTPVCGAGDAPCASTSTCAGISSAAAGRGTDSGPLLFSMAGIGDETLSVGLGRCALSSTVLETKGDAFSAVTQTPAGSALAVDTAGCVHAAGGCVDAVSGGKGTSGVALDSGFPRSGPDAGAGSVSAGAALNSFGSDTTCSAAPPAGPPRSTLTNGWRLASLVSSAGARVGSIEGPAITGPSTLPTSITGTGITGTVRLRARIASAFFCSSSGFGMSKSGSAPSFTAVAGGCDSLPTAFSSTCANAFSPWLPWFAG